MKVVVIGSGNITGASNSASYLIDNHIMIDMPNGCCKAMKKLSYSETDIKYLLLTHFHGDHYFDIPFYLLGRVHSENVDKNIYFFTSKDGIRKIKKLTKLGFPNSLDKIYANTVINYITNLRFSIEDIEVEKVLVDHGELKPAYGYILTRNGINVGFSGDTCLCENAEYLASKCLYLFTDCSKLIGNDKHMGIDNIEYLSDKYQNCTFIVSHMDDEVREELHKKKLKNIIIPSDGDIIEIAEV